MTPSDMSTSDAAKVRQRVEEIRREQAGPPATDEQILEALKPYIEKAASQERTSCLVQLHWMNDANPSETMLIAQTEWDGSRSIHDWAQQTAKDRISDCPEGWSPMICTEDHESFWWKFGDKIGPRGKSHE